jgi:RHS repeat-associated protein
MNKTTVPWRVLHIVTIVSLLLALLPAPAGALERPASATQTRTRSVQSGEAAPAPPAADAPALVEHTAAARQDPLAPPSPSLPAAASPVVGPGGGVARSSDGRVVLSFPPGAVQRSTTVTIAEQARDAKTPSHLFHVFSLQARDDLGAEVERFAQPVVASVILRPSDVEGMQGSPAIFWLNEKGEWVALVSRMDWGQSMVTVAIEHFSTFGAGILTALSFGAQDLPTVHGFTSDDWSGNSSIHYPLNLPPGPGKLGLSLSLDYSSESVNGIRGGPEYDGGTNLDQQRANTFNRQASYVGWGWNLGGLGAIVNNLAAGITNTYLNAPGLSVQLVSTTGNGWQTDPQTFASIGHGTDKFSSEPWLVRTTDGMTFTFGSTLWGNGVAWNINDGTCNEVLREAHLTEVRDTYGNRAAITYAAETRAVTACTGKSYVRALRPTRIEYFARGEALSTARIDFGYSTRSDTNVVGYNNDFAEVYWSNYRLTSITVKVRTGTLDTNFATARTYQFDHAYQHNGDPAVSIMTLSYIRQLGSSGGALPDWTFSYQKFYGWLNFVLLQYASNGQGGSVGYAYVDVGNIWIEGCGANTRRWRVSLQEIGDGMGNTLRTVINSQYPWSVSGAQFPQCPNFEFAGYGNVERQLKDGNDTVYQVTASTYHQTTDGIHLDPKKGKIQQAQTKDGIGGSVIAQTNTTWTATSERQTNWVYKADETSWVGNANTAHITRYYYTTDHQNGGQFGNVTHVKESLDTSATIYRTREAWYYPQTASGQNYIVNRPARQILLDGDVGGVCKADTRYLYDGNTGYNQVPIKGDVTKTRTALDACGDGAVFSDNQAAYDAYGNQTSATDANGNVTTTVYDTTGGWSKLFALPTSITLPAVDGVTFTSIYTWNKTIAQVTNVKDPNAAITTYQYDQWARQQKLWKPGDSTAGAASTVFTYTNYVNSTSPFRVQQSQCDSRTTCSATSYLDSVTFYDGLGRVIQTQAEGATASTSTLANTRYNPLGKVISQTVSYAYAGAAGPYRTPDWTQPTTHYAYDLLARPTLTTQPDGTTVRSYYNYPGSGRSQAAAIDALNHMALQESDVLGRLKEARQYTGSYPGLPGWNDAAYATAAYGYDVGDRLTSTNDPIGAQASMGYDAAGRKTSMSDPDMGAWSYGYDAAGNLTRQTDARNQTTCFYYDAQNRLKGKNYQGSTSCPSDPGTYTVSYGYDSGANGKGRRTRMDDQSGNTQWTYDARGRMSQETKVVTGVGTFVSKWAYDGADRVIAQTYPKNASGVTGERVDTYYTTSGLVSYVQGMTGTVNYATGLTYNALGRPITTTLGNGTSLTWGYWGVGGDYDTGPAVGLTSYGALWRIRAATSVGEPRFDVRYSYDAAGNVARAAEAPRSASNWPTTYSFQDEFNSLDTNNWTFSSYQTIVSDGGNNVLRSQGNAAWGSYFYRGNSGGSGYVLTSGEGLQVRFKVSADNTLAHVSIEANDATYRRFGVVHRGKRLDVQYFDNGTGVARYPASILNNVELNVWYVVRIVLDDSARGFYVEAYKESAPTTRGSYSTRMPSGLSWRFIHYCASGYAYFDAYKEFATGGMAWSPDVRHAYTYDALNRLTGVAPFDSGQGYTGSYGYDAAGRFTTKNNGNGAGTYAYTDNNHKHAVTAVGSPQNWSFGYDFTGNMTSRNLGATSYGLSYDAENRLSSVSGSGSATFWYDGDGKRVKATQGAGTTTYIGDYFEWDGTTARVYYYAGGRRIGTRLGTGTVSYILSDSLGSTSVTLDSSQGATAETRYKAYGEDYTSSGTQPTAFRFTGQRLDAGIQLYFYNARYYDHIVGRFVQADTIVPQPGNPQGLNRYSYVLNNPQRYVDPSGHDVGCPGQDASQCAPTPRTGTYDPKASADEARTLAWQWFSETGPDYQTFGPDSSLTMDIMNDPGMAQFYAAWAEAGYPDTFSWRHQRDNRDASIGSILGGLLLYGKANALMIVAFVGFGSSTPEGQIDAVGGVIGSLDEISVKPGRDGMLTIRVDNSMDWGSGTRLYGSNLSFLPPRWRSDTSASSLWVTAVGATPVFGPMIERTWRNQGGTTQQAFYWYVPKPAR